MIVIEILLSGLATVVLVPTAVLFIQVLMAMPVYRSREIPEGERPSVAVLVPAHNEAPVVANALASIVHQLAERDRLLVIADNCTDDTARIACVAGAEVIERKDEVRRGKGYALDFGVRHLERNPPDVVVIMDADCQAYPGTIDRLARLCGQYARPVQALYLMRSPLVADLKTRVAEFAWLVRNQVRPLGYQRLGMPCQLMGTGMAIPWSGIRTAPLATGHLVEDLMLGVSLARSGTPPLFCPEALVESFFPTSVEGIQAQRTRWEHGHLGMIIGDVPRLLTLALARGNLKLLGMVVDLCVPPLALLMLLGLAVLVAGALFFAVSRIALPASLAAAALALLGAAVLMAWSRYGRRVISLSNLAYAPIYALGKMRLYVKFLLSRQVEWVRSKRERDE